MFLTSVAKTTLDCVTDQFDESLGNGLLNTI